MWINFVRMRSANASHLHSWHTTIGNQKCRLCEFPCAENNYMYVKTITSAASYLTHNKFSKSREITLSKHSYSVCKIVKQYIPKTRWAIYHWTNIKKCAFKRKMFNACVFVDIYPDNPYPPPPASRYLSLHFHTRRPALFVIYHFKNVSTERNQIDKVPRDMSRKDTASLGKLVSTIGAWCPEKI